LATVDRKVDRSLLTSRIEVSSPKYNILAAKMTNQWLTPESGRRLHAQSIVTSIQDVFITIVGL
jgi:hypothetical protein